MSESGWAPPTGDSSVSRMEFQPLKKLVAPVLDAFRKRGRPVLWTPPALGGGNHLYMWLHVWSRRASGEPAAMLLQPGMEQWIEEFPRLNDLSIARPSVRFTDRRVMSWNQKFGDFPSGHLESFVRNEILSSSRFNERIVEKRREFSAQDTVINIRRGDYYSNCEHYKRYGVDQKYLLGLARQALGEPPRTSTVWVVSDDPDWAHQFVSREFTEPRVQPIHRTGMFDDLASLASAPRLVLSNSTFSYWGGYLNTILSGNPKTVYVPTFHLRNPDWGRAWQRDPEWNELDNYPYELMRVNQPRDEEP